MRHEKLLSEMARALKEKDFPRPDKVFLLIWDSSVLSFNDRMRNGGPPMEHLEHFSFFEDAGLWSPSMVAWGL